MFQTNEHLEALSAEDRTALEQVVERFEAAWSRGERPDLAACLPAGGPLRQAILVELACADLEYRLKAGEPARAEAYLTRFPELAADRPAVLGLASLEFAVRRRSEPGLAVEEYLARFPQHAADLRGRLAEGDRRHALTEADAPRLAPAPRPAPPSIDSSATLTDALRASRLLEPAQIDELTVLQSRVAEPKALARELLRRDWLTPFQVNQVFQGKANDLVLGDYVLLERLGEGGMGQVFKARHVLMGRVVAVKVIRKDRLSGPDTVRRFYREIRAAAQLAHPNIVLAYDAAQVGDTHLLVMEYVDGTDLSKTVRQRGPLPAAEACDYVRQAALGLQHAHEKGLIHRDIKPGNLLLAKGGVVKVLDMGLARLSAGGGAEGGELTAEGAVMGTPDYIAPEQAQESHTVDIRADIYSLGCTLYYLLTGRPPFPGGTMVQKLLKHQKAEPAPVEEQRPDLPAGLGSVLRKMMAKRPGDRYQTPGAVAAALEVFCGVRPPLAVPLSAAELTALTSRPPEARVVAGEVTAVLVAGGPRPAAVEAVPLAGQRPLSSSETLPPGSSDSVPSETRLRAPPGRWAGLLARWRRLDRRVRLGAAGGMAAGLVVLVAVLVLALRGGNKPPDDLRKPEPVGLDRLDPGKVPPEDQLAWHKALPSIRGYQVRVAAVLGEHRLRHGNYINWLAVSRDGKLAVTGSADNTVRLSNARTQRQQKVFEPGVGQVLAVALSPDGRTVAAAGTGNDVALLDAAGQGEPRLLKGHSAGIHGVAFSPDGKRLASCSADNSVRLWGLAAGRQLGALPLQAKMATRFVAFTDSSHLLTGGGGQDPKTQEPVECDVRLWELADPPEKSKAIRTFKGSTGTVCCGALSPDGRTLITGDANSQVRFWDFNGAKEVCPARPAGGRALGAAFSADGKHALVTWSNGLDLWEAENGRLQRRVFSSNVQLSNPAFLGDTHHALFAEGTTLRLFDAATGKDLRPIRGHAAPVRAVAFGPKDQHLFSGGGDGGVLMWDLRAGGEPKRIASGMVANLALAFPGAAHRFVLTTTGLGHEPGLRVSEVPAEGVKEGRQLDALRAGEPQVVYHGVAATRDGRRAVVSCSDSTLRVWDIPGGKKPREIKVGQLIPRRVVLSPDDRLAAVTANDGLLHLIDLGTGKDAAPAYRSPSGDAITAAAFTPKGDGLYFGTSGGWVGTWDPKRKPEEQDKPWLRYHDRGGVEALALSPDGKTLATGDTAGHVVIWNTDEHDKLAEWAHPAAAVNALAFASDGRHLAAANGDTTVYVYRLAPPTE